MTIIRLSMHLGPLAFHQSPTRVSMTLCEADGVPWKTAKRMGVIFASRHHDHETTNGVPDTFAYRSNLPLPLSTIPSCLSAATEIAYDVSHTGQLPEERNSTHGRVFRAAHQSARLFRMSCFSVHEIFLENLRPITLPDHPQLSYAQPTKELPVQLPEVSSVSSRCAGSP